MSEQLKLDDQRKYPRMGLMEYASILKPGQSLPARSVVVDVSLGGMQLRTQEPIEVGVIHQLEIGQGGEPPVRLNAECRYSKQLPDCVRKLFAVGFSFRPQSDAEKRILVSYLNGLVLDQGESLVS